MPSAIIRCLIWVTEKVGALNIQWSPKGVWAWSFASSSLRPPPFVVSSVSISPQIRQSPSPHHHLRSPPPFSTIFDLFLLFPIFFLLSIFLPPPLPTTRTPPPQLVYLLLPLPITKTARRWSAEWWERGRGQTSWTRREEGRDHSQIANTFGP